jgi:flagellar hook assembly protein FlgD
LGQNWPNPFNSTTAISYQLSGVNPHHTTLKIYNILGEEVVTLVNQRQRPGLYRIVWDGKDGEERDVGSGIYFYKLKVEGPRLKVVKTRKLVLLR